MGDWALGGTRTLFVVSVLALFLELMLIRWVGTEIRIFAYLQNTVLVVCFLGLGLGCLTCRMSFTIRSLLVSLSVLVLLFALPFSRIALSRITEMLSAPTDLLIWSPGPTVNRWYSVVFSVAGLGLTFLLMVLIWEVFIPLGRLLGRLLDEHPRPIWAYSVNVGGSLIGIWLFVLLSAFDQPPTIWFAVAAFLLAVLILTNRSVPDRRIDLLLSAGLIVLAYFAQREPGAMEVHWSPYQKLALYKTDPEAAKSELRSGSLAIGEIGNYLVMVNNTGYQEMIDLSASRVESDPARFPASMRGMSQYDIPFLLHPRPVRVLIVGAGSGNDAAGALRQGVEHVTAVEIDPVIASLGQRFHPERPYDSPRVELVRDDARSFFGTTRDRYDVISFGLLDSHTTTAMSNIRLDHFVYTKESLQDARSLLSDGGVMVMSFFVQRPFIADRMVRVLREVFGQEPICFKLPQTYYGRGGMMFIAGNIEQIRRRIAGNPRLASLIEQWQRESTLHLAGTTPIATDDWPYIYLETPRVPLLHYLITILMALLLFRGAVLLKIRGMITDWNTTYWHFFFLGAAFLLLEIQNISKASVVLGNTWLVNAVIISGILAMVLLANLITARFPTLPSWPIYSGLGATCVLLYFIDIAGLGFLPYAFKALVVGGLTSLPMLFGGIIFIRSFTAAKRKDQALGANLIGSLVGGLLQSITFVTGIRALLLIVSGLYLAALWTRPKPTVILESTRIPAAGSDSKLPREPAPSEAGLESQNP